MSHVYLAASLPGLDLGHPPPLGLETFAARCAGVLEAPALADVQNLLAGEDHNLRTEPGRRWQALETQLRNEVATARRPNQDLAHPFYTGYSVEIRDSVRRAFGAQTPLKRERILDRCRFALLEELAEGNTLSLGRIIGFAGQLRLVHRWAGWDQQAGRRRFADMVGTLRDTIIAGQDNG